MSGNQSRSWCKGKSLVFAIICGSLAVHGQDGLERDVPAAATILKAFEGYNAALVAKDYAKLRAEYLYVPFTLTGQLIPQIITDLDIVLAGLRKTRDSLDALGYETSKVLNPRISILNSDAALLNCRIQHYKKDGSLIAERANFYILIKVNGAWKLGGVMPQDPNFTGQTY